MKTPDEINMNSENAFLLREAAKAHDMGYCDHLANGGKGDPAEERWIEALDAGADALERIRQLEKKCRQLEREKDALLDALKKADVYGECGNCKHRDSAPSDCDFECGSCQRNCRCWECRDGDKWEWVGVKEDSDEQG